MTEKTVTPKPRSEAAKARTAKAKSRLARQSHTARNRFLILLFLFVSLLAASGYLLTQLALMRGQVEILASENAELADTEAAHAATIETMQEQLAAPPEPAPMDLAPLEDLEQRLRQETDSLSRRLSEVSAAQRGLQARSEYGWKLREAANLLNLADRKLRLEADIHGAIALFESADQALVDAERDGVLHIRQAIAEEAARLRALEAVDREGIWFRLESLQGEISRLDLLASLRGSVAASAAPANSPETGWLTAGLEFLGSVFVWRRWEERPELELVAGREEFIREAIRLRIAQAQLALLRRDSAMYRVSLQAGRDELRGFAADESVARLTAELNALLAIEIAPELPVLNESLDLLGEFLTGLSQ